MLFLLLDIRVSQLCNISNQQKNPSISGIPEPFKRETDTKFLSEGFSIHIIGSKIRRKNFGTDHRWGQKSRSLCSAVGSPDEKLARFIHDYKANIFEIAWLDDETVAKFKSDFRIVADYFVQMRKNHDYVPSAEVINHVEEVLNLMAAVSGDRRFEITQNETAERKVSKMEEWLTRRLDRATAETLVGNIDSLIKNEGFSIERACHALNSTVTKYEAAKKLLADAAAAV